MEKVNITLNNKDNIVKGNITPNEIVEKIKNSKNIVLTAHINPDGDALGALLAFYLIINEYNKKTFKTLEEYIKVNIFLDDNQPKYMEKFEQSKLVNRYVSVEETLKIINGNFKTSMDFENSESSKNSENSDEISNIDLFISLDCANKERYGKCLEIKEIAKESINIDHHISNTEHADFNYIENICSTTELLYQFLELFDIKLTKEIGDFIYLGIINDTGNFRHDNVTSNTFFVCSKLMEVGVNNHKIANIIFEVSMKKINLLGEVYKNKVVDEKNNFIYYYLSQEVIKKLDIKKDDTDGIAETLLKIEGTELSLFAREEEDGTIKGSFRCNNGYNVNDMAAMFNGGGHIKAAGFKTNLSLNEILSKVNEYLKKYKG